MQRRAPAPDNKTTSTWKQTAAVWRVFSELQFHPGARAPQWLDVLKSFTLCPSPISQVFPPSPDIENQFGSHPTLYIKLEESVLAVGTVLHWLAGSARAELCCVKGGGTFIPVKVFAHCLLDVRSCKLLNEISDTFRSCSVSFFPLNQVSAHKPWTLLLTFYKELFIGELSLFSYYEKITDKINSTTVWLLFQSNSNYEKCNVKFFVFYLAFEPIFWIVYTDETSQNWDID